jgi:hypothetical protein
MITGGSAGFAGTAEPIGARSAHGGVFPKHGVDLYGAARY